MVRYSSLGRICALQVITGKTLAETFCQMTVFEQDQLDRRAIVQGRKVELGTKFGRCQVQLWPRVFPGSADKCSLKIVLTQFNILKIENYSAVIRWLDGLVIRTLNYGARGQVDGRVNQ